MWNSNRLFPKCGHIRIRILTVREGNKFSTFIMWDGFMLKDFRYFPETRTATEYRTLQSMFRSNKLEAYNEALLADPIDKQRRKDLADAYGIYLRRWTLSGVTARFANQQVTEKAVKILESILNGENK